MKKLFVSLSALILAPLLAVAQASEIAPKKNVTWVDFADGSWVVVKERQSRGELKMTSTLKYLRNQHGELEVLKKTENGFEEDFSRSIPLGGFDPRKSAQFSRLAPENVVLKIDGKDYKCLLEAYTLSRKNDKGEKMGSEIKLWICKDVLLPHRTVGKRGPDLALGKHVLKAYFKTNKPNLKEEATIQVIKMNEKLKVGGKEVACCTEVMTQTMEQKRERRGEKMHIIAKAEMTQITSRNVPGHLVKLLGKASLIENGKESQVSVLKEVTDFKAAKK